MNGEFHKRTKIIGTLGPSTDAPGVVARLLSAGLDLARLNFSHGSYDEHQRRLDVFRAESAILGRHTGVVVDIQGPKIRTGVIPNGPVMLAEGSSYVLTTREIAGDENLVHVGYPRLSQDLKPGMTVFLDDARLELRVMEISGQDVRCEVVNGGELSSRKGVTLPDIVVDLPGLTDKDEADIRWAVQHGADFIAASFVRCAENIEAVAKIINEAGGRLGIIAKIENREGIENIDEIIQAANAIMIARGDMGVSIPAEDVPVVQKEIIRKCNRAGKPVITATQMLDSMQRNPRPTRAEVTDVANAILDGSDAVMLSGETASGGYPAEAVRMMAKVIRRTEEVLPYSEWLRARQADRLSISDAISHATCETAEDLGAAAIISSTQSGSTARLVAKYRPQAPIVAATPDEQVARRLSLVWGASPVLVPASSDIDTMLDVVVKAAVENGFAKSGDLVVITAGLKPGVAGSTNLLKVHAVK